MPIMEPAPPWTKQPEVPWANMVNKGSIYRQQQNCKKIRGNWLWNFEESLKKEEKLRPLKGCCSILQSKWIRPGNTRQKPSYLWRLTRRSLEILCTKALLLNRNVQWVPLRSCGCFCIPVLFLPLAALPFYHFQTWTHSITTMYLGLKKFIKSGPQDMFHTILPLCTFRALV